jgi:hypothetical protein
MPSWNTSDGPSPFSPRCRKQKIKINDLMKQIKSDSVILCILQILYHRRLFTMDSINAMNILFTILNTFAFNKPYKPLDVMQKANTYIFGSVSLLALHPNTFISIDIYLYISSHSEQRFVDYINIWEFSKLLRLFRLIQRDPSSNLYNFHTFQFTHCHSINIVFTRTSYVLKPPARISLKPHHEFYNLVRNRRSISRIKFFSF